MAEHTHNNNATWSAHDILEHLASAILFLAIAALIVWGISGTLQRAHSLPAPGPAQFNTEGSSHGEAAAGHESPGTAAEESSHSTR